MAGIPWEVLRPHAMLLEEPLNSITIDLSLDDQKTLKGLIDLQRNAGGVNQTIGKDDRIKICNMPWKKLKFIVMNGNTENLK